jgi:hypothetical protein
MASFSTFSSSVKETPMLPDSVLDQNLLSCRPSVNVTAPVGIRMNKPRMAALLTSSGRPGFYFRMLEKGDVGVDEGRGGQGANVGRRGQRLLHLPRHSFPTSM